MKRIRLFKYPLCTLLFILILSVLGSLKQVNAQRNRDRSHPRNQTKKSNLNERIKSEVLGVWVGDYRCDQDHHSLLLEVTKSRHGKLLAVFHGLYQDHEYLSFEMRAQVVKAKRALKLEFVPGRWITKPDHAFMRVAMKGRIHHDELKGSIEHQQCGQVTARRLECDFSEAQAVPGEIVVCLHNT